jgi:hypothetical protein
MKIITLLLTSYLLIHAIPPKAMAQEDKPTPNWNVELGCGLNVLGPGRQMADLMVEYEYDFTTTGWLSGEPIEHPHFNAAGFSAHMSFLHYIGERSQLGILVNYSDFDEVFGYSDRGGYLFVKFSSLAIIPIYSWDLNENIELAFGPAIMINSGRKTSMTGPDQEEYCRTAAALLTGLSWKVWQGRMTYGKIGTRSQLSYGNKMGPFSSENPLHDNASIAESRINYSNLQFFFAVGLSF